MSARRTMKKTIYATIFWVGVILIVGIIIWPLLPEKAVVVAPLKNTAHIPIVVENVVVIPHIEKPGPFGRTIDVVARLKNDNARAGTGIFPVKLLVKDASGAVIATVDQNAYVLPGGAQYVAFVNVVIPSDKQFAAASIETSPSISLTQLPDTARLPEFGIFLRERTQLVSGSQNLEQQTGVVTNNSTFDWEKVEVLGVAFDASGKIVGVGKTFVGKLLLGEQREFTLVWPAPVDPTLRVLAIATTNIYIDENIVHIIGDPSSLR